jgi:phosphatidylglycerophosphatase A
VSRLARHLATLGPVGWSPFAPASAASAVVAVVGWFLPVPPLWLFSSLLLAGALLAVWVCGVAERRLGHDAKPIVADEVIGMTLSLLWVPHHPAAFAAAFFLFRVMDVWKPLGARKVQKLRGGWGIVADDVLAGIYACATFHVAAFLAGLPLLTRP